MYKTYMTALLKKANSDLLIKDDLDFPNATDGVEGVKFPKQALQITSN